MPYDDSQSGTNNGGYGSGGGPSKSTGSSSGGSSSSGGGGRTGSSSSGTGKNNSSGSGTSTGWGGSSGSSGSPGRSTGSSSNSNSSSGGGGRTGSSSSGLGGASTGSGWSGSGAGGGWSGSNGNSGSVSSFTPSGGGSNFAGASGGVSQVNSGIRNNSTAVMGDNSSIDYNRAYAYATPSAAERAISQPKDNAASRLAAARALASLAGRYSNFQGRTPHYQPGEGKTSFGGETVQPERPQVIFTGGNTVVPKSPNTVSTLRKGITPSAADLNGGGYGRYGSPPGSRAAPADSGIKFLSSFDDEPGMGYEPGDLTHRPAYQGLPSAVARPSYLSYAPEGFTTGVGVPQYSGDTPNGLPHQQSNFTSGIGASQYAGPGPRAAIGSALSDALGRQPQKSYPVADKGDLEAGPTLSRGLSQVAEPSETAMYRRPDAGYSAPTSPPMAGQGTSFPSNMAGLFDNGAPQNDRSDFEFVGLTGMDRATPSAKPSDTALASRPDAGFNPVSELYAGDGDLGSQSGPETMPDPTSGPATQKYNVLDAVRGRVNPTQENTVTPEWAENIPGPIGALSKFLNIMSNLPGDGDGLTPYQRSLVDRPLGSGGGSGLISDQFDYAGAPGKAGGATDEDEDIPAKPPAPIQGALQRVYRPISDYYNYGYGPERQMFMNNSIG